MPRSRGVTQRPVVLALRAPRDRGPLTPAPPDVEARRRFTSAALGSMTPEEDLVPPPEDYNENGVDRTLTRSSLENTPLECLQALEEMLQLMESVRRRD